MAVPDFQSFMLPVLEVFGDGTTHDNQDVYGYLLKTLSISDKDLDDKLPSGKKSRFHDRAQWALVHLTQAGLLETVGRGQRRIAERGMAVLAKKPKRIDLRFLSQYEEYRRFREGTSKTNGIDVVAPAAAVESVSEDEALQGAFNRAMTPRRLQILQSVLGRSDKFFENFVLELLRAAGYGDPDEDALKHLGKPGDGGVDGVIREDTLGLELVYMQAKKYSPENIISREEVQKFSGSLDQFRARKGVFVTTSSFSKPARDYVRQIEKKIALIDGAELVNMMLKFNVGVRLLETYELKGADQDFFDEDRYL